MEAQYAERTDYPASASAPEQAPPSGNPAKATDTKETPYKVLRRPIGMSDIGWFTRILDNARDAGRLRAEANGVDLARVDMLKVLATSWDVVEEELVAWVKDLTGCGDTQARDLNFIADTVEEMDEHGGLGRFLRVISRLQNLQSAGTPGTGS